MRFSASHRRWNPLQESWVLVSPQRTMRPWQGAREEREERSIPSYAADCYLCPRNLRANGTRNPDYAGIHVFNNDFSALAGDSAEPPVAELRGLIQAQAESGQCRVMCFTPQHNVTFADLEHTELVNVIQAWEQQYEELAAERSIRHVMIFENKGAMMGCSNPHPHCQIWATHSIPTIPAQSAHSQKKYLIEFSRPLLKEYLEWELEQRDRIVNHNEEWLVIVPFWAVWPFETMIIPRRPAGTIRELSHQAKEQWASIQKDLTQRYDRLFDTSFPYSMGIYQRPSDGEPWEGFILHQVFYPPLLRSASIKKFMVGFELCAEPQRDLTPEDAARRLRECL